MNRGLFASVLLAAALSGCAATAHRHNAPLAETGHATFAALEEAVAALRRDPDTDWATVDVDGLRAHLLDMDHVTLRARVVSEDLPNGARYRVTGDGDVVGAIQRMAVAHAGMVNSDAEWFVDVESIATGALVTVRAASDQDAEMVRALGFFGFLTLGAHHQAHHWAMVSGADPHSH